jgi:hypothetical protein
MEVDRVGCEGGSEKMFKELGRLAGPKTCHLLLVVHRNFVFILQALKIKK